MSIQNQNFKNYEVWIIDNASNDGTAEYLLGLKNPFHWISEPDKGVYDAMNKGISLSLGKWLYFLGADDRLYNPSVLSDLFSKPIPSKVKMLIGKIQYNWVMKDSNFIKRSDGLVNSSLSKKLWIKNSLHHQSIFYRNELFINGGYSLNYNVLADYAFNLNLYRANTNVKDIDIIITTCGTSGLSKKYNWALYKEEIEFKIAASSPFLKPFFYLICFTKYLIKKINV